MPPSQVRKEEAELRKIAKQARDTRKQVKAREKKQQLRRLTKGDADSHNTETTTATSAPRKRQAALILPDEITELRTRLGLASSTSSPTAADKSKKTSPKKGAAGAKKKAAAVSAEAVAAAGPSPQAIPEPPYHLEVHFRRKELQVDVTLHKIPESKIDVSETNAHQLVVDTTKHTKRWRLVLPCPEGVTVDSEAGTYELENGVLRCRMPLVGDVPSHLQEKWDAVVEKMRDQRAMRFRVTQDGALTVRTRRALLKKDGDVPAPAPAKKAAEETEPEADGKAKTSATNQPKKSAQKRGRPQDEAEAESKPAAKPAPQGKGKSGAAAAAPADKRAKTETTPSSAAKAPTPKDPKAAKKADVFKQEHARAMEIAKAAGVQSKASIRERVQQALVVQKKRQAKMDTRDVRKAQKLERRQNSFAKVLKQQKEQLLAQAALVESAKPKPAAAKKDNGKSVSFAG